MDRRSKMTTTNTISAADRLRVAEALFPKHTFANHEWFVKDGGVFSKTGYGSFVVFDPQYYPQQKDALTRTAAQLIEAVPESEKDYAPDPRRHYDPLLRHAIARNDVPAIEALVLQLLEARE